MKASVLKQNLRHGVGLVRSVAGDEVFMGATGDDITLIGVSAHTRLAIKTKVSAIVDEEGSVLVHPRLLDATLSRLPEVARITVEAPPKSPVEPPVVEDYDEEREAARAAVMAQYDGDFEEYDFDPEDYAEEYSPPPLRRGRMLFNPPESDNPDNLDFQLSNIAVDAVEPQLPAVDGQTVGFAPATLAYLLRRTLFSAAKEEHRAILQSVNLAAREEGQKLAACAADGFRLAKVEGEVSDLPEDFEVNLPLAGASQVLRLCRGFQDASRPVLMRVSAVTGNILFLFVNSEGREVELAMSAVAGAFPNYEALIPFQAARSMTIPVSRFRSAVQNALGVSNTGYVWLNLLPGRANGFNGGLDTLKVLSKGDGVGSYSTRVPIRMEGPPLEIVFTAKYLTEYLSLLPGDAEVVAEFNEKQSPLVLRSQDAPQSEAYVVMPLFMNEDGGDGRVDLTECQAAWDTAFPPPPPESDSPVAVPVATAPEPEEAVVPENPPEEAEEVPESYAEDVPEFEAEDVPEFEAETEVYSEADAEIAEDVEQKPSRGNRRRGGRRNR